MRRAFLALVLLVASCGERTAATPETPEVSGRTRPVRVSVVGTNDLHGHIERLPLLAGHVDVLRRTRDVVVPLDAGDMFQGTLASNLAEGAPIVAAYNAIGYRAAAIGNHEFDFGPVGEAVVAERPGDDPRGALKARAAEARFPFLAANVLDAATGAPVAWPNTAPTTLFEAGGVRIGVIGVTTESTPRTTLAANVADLRIAPLAETIAARAAELRGQGAELVLVAAHAGAVCRRFDDPDDLSSCDPEEIFPVARALPPGSVDVIVAGHTHAGVAHRVDGIAIIESFAKGSAFGRVDLTVQPDGSVTDVVIHPPRNLCRDHRAPFAECETPPYEGHEVAPDPEVARIAAAAAAVARARAETPLGVTAAAPIRRSRAKESPLGNLFADLMRAARPRVDVALQNGGGLRADLPAGPITYGDLYEAFPFDNRFATVRLTGAQLAQVLARNLRGDHGILSVSGVRARARCEGSELVVTLRGEDGTPIAGDAPLLVGLSDFLASGGDALFEELDLAADAVSIESGETIRDAMAEVLRARGGELDTATFYEPDAPRIRYPGRRPVACPAS